MASSILVSSTKILCLLSLLFALSINSVETIRSPSPARRILAGSSPDEEHPTVDVTVTPPKKKKTNTTAALSINSAVVTMAMKKTKKNNQTTLVTVKPPKKTGPTVTTTDTGKLISSAISKSNLNKTATTKPNQLKQQKLEKLEKQQKQEKLEKQEKQEKLEKLEKQQKQEKQKKLEKQQKQKKQEKQQEEQQEKQQEKEQEKEQEKQREKRKAEAVRKPEKIMPWAEESETEEDSDLMSELTDLASKFQQTLLPDLEHLSTKSKAYLMLANQEFTNSFTPLVGNRYAPTIATLASAVFLLLPLALLTLVFQRLRHSPSLQNILLAIQIYLAIYFAVLSLTALVTGLEPLRFFYAASRGSYVYTQVLQTMGFAIYLLLRLMNLLVVFSGDSGAVSRVTALLQVALVFAVGLHYYAAVFHRAVRELPAKTNWKIHAVYAACFALVCLFARAERRKKTYLQEDGDSDDDCKKS